MARTLHPRSGSTALLDVGKVEAMYREGRYEEAIALGEKALAACRALREIPDALEMRILGTLGAAHIAAGEWAEAISVLNDARRQAGSLFDMRQQAKLFTNLAVAYEELGQPDQAIG